MSFSPDFSSSQSSGNLEAVTLTDDSTGSYSGITGRLVTFTKYDGELLSPTDSVTTYVYWPVVSGIGDTLEVDNLLDKDYCLSIKVTYYSGSSISTTKTILTLFTGYGDLFLRQLTQALAGNRITITAQNFWLNKNKLRVLLDDAAQAVSLINDQTIAQFCLDEAKRLSDNQSMFFN